MERLKPYRMDASVRKTMMSLPRTSHWDTCLVDDKSLVVLLRIEKLMNRFVEMGDDHCRYLWVEAKSRRIEWIRISSAYIGDFHYLIFRLDDGSKSAFSSTHMVHSDRAQDILNQPTYDVCDSLVCIESFLIGVGDAILQNPEAYNRYIDRHFSYYEQSGLIRRSVLNALAPCYRLHNVDYRRAIEVLEADTPPISFDQMTLRTYMHYWQMGAKCVGYSFEGLSDLEAFAHSSQGRGVENHYDLNSEEAFKRWMNDVSHYHGFDIIYARLHFFPREEEGGLWTFVLSTHSYWNLDQYIQVAMAFHEKGIPIVLNSRDKILSILRETDYVRITPNAYRYFQEDNVGNEISLPYPDEQISKGGVKQIINQTEWEPVIHVEPNHQ